MVQSSRIRTVGLGILSIFIIWHILGIGFVGPSGKSYLRASLMKLYQDYLAVFHLDRSWPFYSPNPFLGSILRYEVVSSLGVVNTHPLTKVKPKYGHAYFRYTNFYAYLFSNPKYTKERGYDKSVARYLCAQHKGSDIKEINFILLNQKRFTYQDYQEGNKPLDDAFLKKTVFGPYNCSESSQ